MKPNLIKKLGAYLDTKLCEVNGVRRLKKCLNGCRQLLIPKRSL